MANKKLLAFAATFAVTTAGLMAAATPAQAMPTECNYEKSSNQAIGSCLYAPGEFQLVIKCTDENERESEWQPPHKPVIVSCYSSRHRIQYVYFNRRG